MILTQVPDELIIAAYGKCSKWLAWGWQTSVLTPVKGFPIRPREESHELTGLKLQQISLRVASPSFLSVATTSLSRTVLPPFHTDAFWYFCVKLHQLWCNPLVLHALHAQHETTPVQTVLQWSWEAIRDFYYFEYVIIIIFEVEHCGKGHCVAVRFLKHFNTYFTDRDQEWFPKATKYITWEPFQMSVTAFAPRISLTLPHLVSQMNKITVQKSEPSKNDA